MWPKRGKVTHQANANPNLTYLHAPIRVVIMETKQNKTKKKKDEPGQVSGKMLRN